MEIAERLSHLVPHWIEHNESHVEQLEEWAARAREAGLTQAAEEIGAAAGAMREATAALHRARAALEAAR